jgi:hypothetical protein
VLACVAVVVAGVSLFSVWKGGGSVSTATKAVAAVSGVTLLIGFSLVFRLRAGAFEFQARELASPSPQFLYKNNFDVRNLEEDLKVATTNYKWPEEVTRALSEFLEDEKRRSAIRRE